MGTLRVATWVRVSDDKQGEQYGPAAQREGIRAMVERERAQVVKDYYVEDVSGSDVMATPEMRDLLRLCETRQIDGVICFALDRIARVDAFDFRSLEAFKIHGIAVLTVTAGRALDLSNPTDVLTATFLGGIGGYEKAMIKQRTMRGREEARKAGRPACGKLPPGVAYDRKTNVWSYTPEAERVKRAFEMVLKGETRYNVLGPFLGVTWAAVRNTLKNPIYKGWRYYDKKSEARKKRWDGRQAGCKMVPRAEKDILRVEVIDRPLVTPEQWERVQRILETKRESKARRRENNDNVKTYQGFLFCDYCGGVMTTKSLFPKEKRAGYGWGYYVCINKSEAWRDPSRVPCKARYVSGRDMDARIDALLGRELTSKAFAMRLQMALQARMKDGDSAAKAKGLAKEREALERKRASIVDFGLSGMITKADCAKRLAEIDAQIEDATRALDVARGSAASRMTVEQLSALFKPFFRWQNRSRDEKRNTLAAFVPRLRAADDQVVSMFRLLDAATVPVSAAVWQQVVGGSDSVSNPKIATPIATGARRSGKAGKPRLSADSPSSAPGVWIDVRCA